MPVLEKDKGKYCITGFDDVVQRVYISSIVIEVFLPASHQSFSLTGGIFEGVGNPPSEFFRNKTAKCFQTY